MTAALNPDLVPPQTSPTPEARRPLPRELARCDYCGAAEGTAVTGLLADEDGRDYLPGAFGEERFRLIRCATCSLVYLRERPSVGDLDVYYSPNYHCYQDFTERGFVLDRLARLVARGKGRLFQRLLPAGARTVLDYGCGSGTWLRLLRRLGCRLDLVGTDVVEAPLEALRRDGIPAFCCDETNLLDYVEPAGVGVVHLFHVIEHVPSPLRTLAALREVLTPGGCVVGQTPNVASAGCRFWGDLWPQWHIPRHFVLFSDATLRRHAEAAGLEVVHIGNSLSGATQWALGALHWWRRRTGRPFRATREPLYPPLLLTALPLTLGEAWLGRTCHMDFILRRPFRG